MKTLFKRLFLFAAFACFALAAHAQVQCALLVDPSATPHKAGDKFSAALKVEIDPGWHIYSLTQPDIGPIRSEIVLAKDQPFKLVGKVIAPPPERAHSDAFNGEIQSYLNEVVFILPMIATGPITSGTKLKAEFTYQACTEENCMPAKTEKIEVSVTTPPATAK